MPKRFGGKIPEEVKRKLSGGGGGVTTNLFYLMKELHISYSELMEMPISAINVLLLELSEHAEREKKELERAKG